MKKSLMQARQQAIESSKEFPNTRMYVMDKPNGKAVMTASEWVRKERILAGWYTVETYLNGRREGA